MVRIWMWRVFAVVTLLSAGIILGAHLGRSWHDPTHTTQPPDDHPVACPVVPEQPIPVVNPLERYDQLWTAEDDIYQLVVLAEGNDGPAYHARLALARSSLSGEERIQWYQSALSLYNDRSVRIELADLLLFVNNVNDAVNVAASSLPDPAAVSLLLAAGPSLITAEHFINYGFHELALDMLTQLPGELSLMLQAKALLAIGQPGQAAHILQNLDDDAALPDLALAYERSGNLQSALDLYLSLGERGNYGVGRILIRLGRPAEAIPYLIASSHPEAMWTATRLLETRGHPDKAQEIYVDLMDTAARVADDAAFRSWLLAERMGQPRLAEQALQRLPADAHWQHEIGRVPVYSMEPRMDVSNVPVIATANALLKAPGGTQGKTLARIEIGIAAVHGDLDVQVACGLWYAEQGMYHESCRSGIALLNKSQSVTVFELAYPQAYWDLITAAALEFDVDPLLIISVMREESHFSAQAVSWAGAIGLMQIMPDTGQWIAGALKEQISLSSLSDPQTNIRLGAWYLRYLLDLWDNDINLTLASYNGGQGNVARWQNHPLYQSPLDLYVVIDYQETREYITKVKTSLGYYQRLYEGE